MAYEKVLQINTLLLILHILLEFYYYSEDNRYSKFNESYPRFIASDNLVDVAPEDYEDMEEGEGDDEIFTGDIFQSFNKD